MRAHLIGNARRDGKSPACEGWRIKRSKRRGIKRNKAADAIYRQATLPAPEIKIGYRLPVNYTMPRISAGKCEPVHKRHQKNEAGRPGLPKKRGRAGSNYV